MTQISDERLGGLISMLSLGVNDWQRETVSALRELQQRRAQDNGRVETGERSMGEADSLRVSHSQVATDCREAADSGSPCPPVSANTGVKANGQHLDSHSQSSPAQQAQPVAYKFRRRINCGQGQFTESDWGYTDWRDPTGEPGVIEVVPLYAAPPQAQQAQADEAREIIADLVAIARTGGKEEK